MPAYDYRCQQCQTVFEKTQRISEPAGATCPSCGSESCTRLITGGTFHLKGSGWYASDYGGKKPAKEEAVPATGGCGKPECGTGACAAMPGDVN
jgi:putative FmdB family regulatory protein